MYAIQHVEIKNGIHWLISLVYQFDNIYNATSFPHKKWISDNEYLIITKTEREFISIQ